MVISFARLTMSYIYIVIWPFNQPTDKIERARETDKTPTKQLFSLCITLNDIRAIVRMLSSHSA